VAWQESDRALPKCKSRKLYVNKVIISEKRSACRGLLTRTRGKENTWKTLVKMRR